MHAVPSGWPPETGEVPDRLTRIRQRSRSNSDTRSEDVPAGIRIKEWRGLFHRPRSLLGDNVDDHDGSPGHFTCPIRPGSGRPHESYTFTSRTSTERRSDSIVAGNIGPSSDRITPMNDRGSPGTGTSTAPPSIMLDRATTTLGPAVVYVGGLPPWARSTTNSAYGFLISESSRAAST